MTSLNHIQLKRILKYGLVGVSNGIVFFVVAIILSEAGLHYSIYTACAYIIAFINSYFLNKYFTFTDRSQFCPKNMSLFFTINFLNLLAVQLVQFLLIDLARWHEWQGILLGMVIYTVVGFFLNQRLVFKPYTQAP